MNLRLKAASGVKWTTLSAGINTGLRMLQLIILANFLSPEDFGLMAMVWIIIGLVQEYTDLGISSAIIHRQDSTKDQLSSLYWINIFSGMCAFVVVWLIAPLIVHIFNEVKLIKLLQVVAFVFLISPWGMQFNILFQKELKFNFLALMEMFATTMSATVSILCAISGFGVWSLIFGLVAHELTKTAILLSKGLREYRPSLRFCRADLKGYLSFGLYQIGERTVNFISERLDQLLLGSLLGTVALGYYNFAFNLVIQPVTRINPIVTRVAFPVFSKVQNDIGRLKNGYLKVISLLTSINAPLFFGLAMLAPVVLPNIFGEKWNESIILVQILSFVALFRSIGNPIGSLQLARGRPDLGFKWNLFLLIVSIPTIYFGVKFGGTVGVALTLLCLQIIMLALEYLYLVNKLIGSCTIEYFKTILKPIFIAGQMTCILLGTSHIFSSLNPKLFLVVQILAGLISYTILFWLYDKKVILEFWSLIRPKYE